MVMDDMPCMQRWHGMAWHGMHACIPKMPTLQVCMYACIHARHSKGVYACMHMYIHMLCMHAWVDGC
jgi:hypothetical protein